MPDLVQQPWLVVLLRGEVLDTHQPAIIRFDSDTRLSGSTGCNRFVATYQRDGERMIIGPAAGTRMACAPPQMDLETRFYDALAEVTRIRTMPGGVLVLANESGELFRLVPVR